MIDFQQDYFKDKIILVNRYDEKFFIELPKWWRTFIASSITAGTRRWNSRVEIT
jgi:hypothetical protein